jgi:hypothetical protein
MCANAEKWVWNLSLMIGVVMTSGCAHLTTISPTPVPPSLTAPSPQPISHIRIAVQTTSPNISEAESLIPVLYDGALLDQAIPYWGTDNIYFKIWRPPLRAVQLQNNKLSVDTDAPHPSNRFGHSGSVRMHER